MLVADKLALNSGRTNLKAVGVLNRIELVERVVDRARYGLAVVDSNALRLVDEYPQLPVGALLDIADVPERKPKPGDDRLAERPNLLDGNAALAFCHTHPSKLNNKERVDCPLL